MRRLFFVLAFAAFVVTGVFAQAPFHLRAGSGLVLDGGRLGSHTFSQLGYSDSAHTNAFGGGGFFFFDLTYVELSAGLMTGPFLKHWETIEPGLPTESGTDGIFILTRVELSLLGKIPICIGMGDSVLFPLFGAGYDFVLSLSDGGRNAIAGTALAPSDLNTFRLKAGLGMDIQTFSRTFFRASVLGYYRFVARYFRELAPAGAEHHGGFGAIIRFALGWRF